jgi:hypothetical protein
LSWDSFEYAVVSDDGSLQLTPVVGFSVLAVILSDFDERGRDPWVVLLREHGVAVN